MLDKILRTFFYKREKGGVLTISTVGREISTKGLKKIPPKSSGIYESFKERERFYRELFISCSQR